MMMKMSKFVRWCAVAVCPHCQCCWCGSNSVWLWNKKTNNIKRRTDGGRWSRRSF